MREPDNTDVEKTFDALARNYDRSMQLSERFMLGPARGWAVEQTRGRVLELAVGTGLKLPLYGPDVTNVLGVDLSNRMLDLARQRIVDDHLERIEVRRGDVQALDVPDCSVDTVHRGVDVHVLHDPRSAAGERRSVPGAGARWTSRPREHGPSINPLLGAVLRMAEPLFLRFAADHLTRDPVPYLEQAGFTVDQVTRGGRGGVCFRILAPRPA